MPYSREWLHPLSGASLSGNLIKYVDPSTLLVFGSVFLTVYYFTRPDSKNKRFPPGPFKYPIIGNMPQIAMNKSLFQTFENWEKQYGKVFSLRVGVRDLVVVSGYKLCKEALVTKGESFSTRPNDLYIVDKIFHRKGVIWSNGEAQKNLRKFTVATMRDFGVGKKSLEERIKDEARVMIDVFDNMKGEPLHPKRLLGNAVSNIICGIVFGDRFDYNDEKFQFLLDKLDFLFKNFGLQVPENFFPILKYIPTRSPVYFPIFKQQKAAAMEENDQKIREFIQKIVEDHKETFDPDNLRDFIDLYLKFLQDGDTNVEGMTEENIFRTIVDLFLAGSETTSTTLLWMLLYLITYPEVQQKCQQEIDTVVGTSRMVSLSDKGELPYFMATMQEIQRVGNIAPFTAPHTATNDVEVGGYLIPKGTIVMFRLQSVHMDPAHWDEPLIFKPERWLDPNNNSLIKHESFMPFSAGPRTCLGKPLAEMELFLFLTNLLQVFTFKCKEGTSPPPLKGDQPGVTLQPVEYKIVAEKR